jgi:hypothetical protein
MTLRTRAVEANTAEEADANGRRSVLDLLEEDSSEGTDVAPAGDAEDTSTTTEAGQRLMMMSLAADELCGRKDAKLQKVIPIVRQLLEEGYHPILFCRFIPTAEYVAQHLRDKLKGVEVVAVTGTLPPKEREDRVAQLGQAARRVLVCTDCLSEGINLQEHFNAVIHYDLSWNPTRHEQREGRVDRYGQPSPKVRALTYYGIDNQIDGVVLDVLLRKHKAIRNSLGVSVPLPTDSEQVIEAVFKGKVLRRGQTEDQPTLFDNILADVDARWESATEREKRSRTLFAQETIKVDEVVRELQASREAVGSGLDVAGFIRTALAACGAVIEGDAPLTIDLTELPRGFRNRLDVPTRFAARFELPIQDDEIYLSRTHPAVESLAAFVLDAALDSLPSGPARRCGVVRTTAVTRRTTLLLLRHRFHIITRIGEDERQLLAEDAQLTAFAGSPQNPEWLPAEIAAELPKAQPEGNVNPDQARDFLQKVMDCMQLLRPRLIDFGREQGEQLLDAHRRVRQASKTRGVSHHIEAQDVPDVLGVFVYLPQNV